MKIKTILAGLSFLLTTSLIIAQSELHIPKEIQKAYKKAWPKPKEVTRETKQGQAFCENTAVFLRFINRPGGSQYPPSRIRICDYTKL